MSFDIKYGLWPILDSVLDFDKYSQYSLKNKSVFFMQQGLLAT